MAESRPITAEQPDALIDTTEKKQDANIDVDLEALPDIESGTPHDLDSSNKISDETANSHPEGEKEDERQSKRVKLNGDDAQGNQDPSNDTEAPEETAKQEEEEDSFDLRMTWAGQGYDFRVNASDRIYDFKVRLSSTSCTGQALLISCRRSSTR